MSEKKQYRLRRKTCTGSLLLSYREGRLFGFESTLKDKRTKLFLSAKQTVSLMKWVAENAMQEQQLPDVESFTVSEVRKVLTESAKAAANLAIWLKAYKGHFGVGYQHTAKHLVLLQHLDLSHERVVAYFLCKEWWARRNVIEEFCKVQNELNQEIKKAKSGNPDAVNLKNVNQHPDYWDADYHKRLEGKAKRNYERHLTRCGLYEVEHEDWPYTLLGYMGKEEAEGYGYMGQYNGEGRLTKFRSPQMTLIPTNTVETTRNVMGVIQPMAEQFKIKTNG